MQLIPVLDLAHGMAVQARAGDRSRYGPVESALTPGVTGDAVALVAAYRGTLGASQCYVADLDAIQGGDMQLPLLRELARTATGMGGGLLVDAGAADPQEAMKVLATGARQVVAGLENLRAFAGLRAMVEAAPADRVIFSLDLRLGRAVLHPAMEAAASRADPVTLAARAVDAGVKTLLLLDVGRVGTSGGMDLELLKALRRLVPSGRLLAGGGVGGRRDLELIRDAGCDGVLVATALHAGSIGASELRALAAPSGAAAQSSASTSR